MILQVDLEMPVFEGDFGNYISRIYTNKIQKNIIIPLISDVDIFTREKEKSYNYDEDGVDIHYVVIHYGSGAEDTILYSLDLDEMTTLVRVINECICNCYADKENFIKKLNLRKEETLK